MLCRDACTPALWALALAVAVGCGGKAVVDVPTDGAGGAAATTTGGGTGGAVPHACTDLSGTWGGEWIDESEAMTGEWSADWTQNAQGDLAGSASFSAVFGGSPLCSVGGGVSGVLDNDCSVAFSVTGLGSCGDQVDFEGVVNAAADTMRGSLHVHRLVLEGTSTVEFVADWSGVRQE